MTEVEDNANAALVNGGPSDESCTNCEDGDVNSENRNSSLDRRLDHPPADIYATNGHNGTHDELAEDDDSFTDQLPSPSPNPSPRSPISSTPDDPAQGQQPQQQQPKRRTSVYEQKQIDAPSATKGNVIASRTQNLFRQYSKDLMCETEESKNDVAEELKSVKLQYQERLASEEREKEEMRMKRIQDGDDSLSRKSIGSHMDRYLARTQGDAAVRSTSDEDEVDESLYVDERGVKIERSGGKEEIVKPSDSISSIKNRFGNTSNSSWKKPNKEANAEVDASTVSSARNIFKEGETRKPDSPSLNRPSKKVRDPQQIMEMRKQLTYANEEEMPVDGVVKKSEPEEIDSSSKHRALDVYKTLESQKQDNDLKLQKPRTKLITDSEARATMEGIRSVSSSASEAGSDVNDTGIDLTVDTASGYGSAAPCSPSSTYSEDYLSDHKETSSPREDDLKDVSLDSDIPLVHSPTQQVTVSM